MQPRPYSGNDWDDSAADEQGNGGYDESDSSNDGTGVGNGSTNDE